jgi:hypothetical protein
MRSSSSRARIGTTAKPFNARDGTGVDRLQFGVMDRAKNVKQAILGDVASVLAESLSRSTRADASDYSSAAPTGSQVRA